MAGPASSPSSARNLRSSTMASSRATGSSFGLVRVRRDLDSKAASPSVPTSAAQLGEQSRPERSTRTIWFAAKTIDNSRHRLIVPEPLSGLERAAADTLVSVATLKRSTRA